MQVNVLKRYVDRYTKEIKEAGATYEYPQQRARELENAGYVEVITEEKQGGENVGCKKGGKKKK
ncbi:hypothetical protein [Hominibacterium faecale]|uniref:hypothetical protein n=1 Tax=Hominibacterium faecale TaxID=2839743 RepID=UPI0022B2928E|nr:hypothetical protein [Hominibacterium faecale]